MTGLCCDKYDWLRAEDSTRENTGLNICHKHSCTNMVHVGFESHQCLLLQVQVRWSKKPGSVTILATKRSAGVTPEVNLRNPLHMGNEAHKQGFHLGFEAQSRHSQKSKTGVSVAPQKKLMSFKISFFKKGTSWSFSWYIRSFYMFHNYDDLVKN